MASHFCGVFSNPSGRSIFPRVEKSGEFLPDAPKRACVEEGDGSGTHGEQTFVDVCHSGGSMAWLHFPANVFSVSAFREIRFSDAFYDLSLIHI